MTSQRNKFKDAREKAIRVNREARMKERNEIKLQPKETNLKEQILEIKSKIAAVSRDLEKPEFSVNQLILGKKKIYEQTLEKLQVELQNVNNN